MPGPEITRERLNYSMQRKVKWRYLAKKYDRFRREYIVWLDRNNSEPTGQVERHFTAPVTVPDEFLKFPDDKPWRVDLDLDGYARFLKKARQEWEARLADIRGKLTKDTPEEKAYEIAGAPPQDWRLVVLLSRGDPWCVGTQENRTPAVEALIGKAPTAAQLRREREKGPADLRLDAGLEALVGMAHVAKSEFPDEIVEREGYDDDMGDDDLRERAAQPVTARDLDPDGDMARRARMDAALADDEDELTGDIDLDDSDAFEAAPVTDFDPTLAEEAEESFDPKALGGKSVNPRKNRTTPDRE